MTTTSKAKVPCYDGQSFFDASSSSTTPEPPHRPPVARVGDLVQLYPSGAIAPAPLAAASVAEALRQEHEKRRRAITDEEIARAILGPELQQQAAERQRLFAALERMSADGIVVLPPLPVELQRAAVDLAVAQLGPQPVKETEQEWLDREASRVASWLVGQGIVSKIHHGDFGDFDPGRRLCALRSPDGMTCIGAGDSPSEALLSAAACLNRWTAPSSPSARAQSVYSDLREQMQAGHLRLPTPAERDALKAWWETDNDPAALSPQTTPTTKGSV